MAKAVRECIPFMWMAARQTPNFRMINRFRSERMRGVLETIFRAVLQLLADEGCVQLENYFLDGTKIEANANRYTFVWKKSVVKHHVKLQDKVKVLFDQIDEQEQADEKKYKKEDLLELGESSTITAEKLEQAVQKLE